jgi:hypothetical protein
MQYLDALPDWDGIQRVDTLLVDYFGAEDSKYTRAVTRKDPRSPPSRVSMSRARSLTVSSF